MAEDFGPYGVHPFADKFPLMSGDEFERLVASMKEHGFDKGCAIVLSDDGKTLIDGRNRYAAATKAKVTPITTTLFELGVPGDNDKAVADFIVRRNLDRRHLSKDERAFLAAEYVKKYAPAAKERQKAGLKQGSSPRPAPASVTGNTQVETAGGEHGEATELAGKEFQVSRESVKRAKTIKEKAPELEEKVLNHELTLTQAAKIAKNKESNNKQQATNDKAAKDKEAAEKRAEARREKKRQEIVRATEEFVAWVMDGCNHFGTPAETIVAWLDEMDMNEAIKMLKIEGRRNKKSL